MYLATLPEGELAQLGNIARDYDISRNHVVKVVHRLGLLGYLDNKRGKGGGIRLAQSSDKINIGELVSQLESTLMSIDCDALHCRLLPGCHLRRVLDTAMQAYIDTLKQYTLADLVGDHRTHEQLLRMRGLAQ